MATYLLDANHVGVGVDESSLVGQRIYEARRAGSRIGTRLPALCEVEAGIRQVKRKVQYRHDLNHLLLQIKIWPIELKTTRIFGDLHLEMRRAGRALSHVDIIIAALALQMKHTILTTDRDFEAIWDIQTED